MTILEDATFFLDLDGTLFDLTDQPDDVRADTQTAALLERLDRRLGGRLAIISGRSLEQIDKILGDFAARIAVSGSHGCEHRWKGVHAHPQRPPSLDAVTSRFQEFARNWPGVLVEEKSFGVALHYRMAPSAETDVAALAQTLADDLALHLQNGKMMVELRVAGGDKGVAIERLMSRKPMAGTVPVFAGDDVTDETGFTMARALGGHAILVGPPRETAAGFGLPSPATLRKWLWTVVEWP